MKENIQNSTPSNFNTSTQIEEEDSFLESKKERIFDFKILETQPDEIFKSHFYKEPRFRKNIEGEEMSEFTYFKGKYGNEDCDIAISLHENYFGKKEDEKIIPISEYGDYYGMYITRKDGTYNIVREKNEPISIVGVNRIKIVNNKIFAEFQFSNGKSEIREIGREKVLPVYRVYRNNESYDSFFEGHNCNLFKELGEIYNLKEDFITEKGEKILETDQIKKIPDNAIILTDEAALVALPSIKNKHILRIDKILEGNEFDTFKFDYFLKKVNENPERINIFKENISSHVEKEFKSETEKDNNGFIDFSSEEVKKEYIEYLKREILKVFKNVEIKIIEKIEELKESDKDGCINIIDRHSGIGDLRGIYDNSRTLKLPLYEMETNKWDKEFEEDRLQILKEKIDSIDVD